MALIGGGAAWNELGERPGQFGVFLAVLDYHGRRYLFSTSDITIESRHGPMRFPGGIAQDLSFTESVDVFNPATGFSGDRSVSLTVSDRVFPIDIIRRVESLQGITAEIRWTVAGLPIAYEDTVRIVRGLVAEVSRNESAGQVSFNVGDGWYESDDPFKIVTATVERLPGLIEEDAGKGYPIVFGQGKKVPALQVLVNPAGGSPPGSGETHYMVAADPFLLLQAGACTYIGNGDDVDATSLILSQDVAYDSKGYPYWNVVINATGMGALVADVTGYTSGTMPEIVRRLCAFFTEHREVVDLGMLEEMCLAYGVVRSSMVINSDPEMNGIRFVTERFGDQLPFYAVRTGDRYMFRAPRWAGPPSMSLSTGRDIVRKVTPVQETPRAEVFSSFELIYGKEGADGDGQASVEATPDTSGECLRAFMEIGPRRARIARAGDVEDVHGGQAALRWGVDTNSMVRVSVGYECTLRALRLTLLDNVRVYDDEEGWMHGPVFKVVKVTLGTSDTVVVGLISVRGTADVYDANRAEAGLALEHPQQPPGPHWGDGLPGGVVDDGGGPRGFPDF